MYRGGWAASLTYRFKSPFVEGRTQARAATCIAGGRALLLVLATQPENVRSFFGVFSGNAASVYSPSAEPSVSSRIVPRSVSCGGV